jgi:hypothetical protein
MIIRDLVHIVALVLVQDGAMTDFVRMAAGEGKTVRA